MVEKVHHRGNLQRKHTMLDNESRKLQPMARESCSKSNQIRKKGTNHAHPSLKLAVSAQPTWQSSAQCLIIDLRPSFAGSTSRTAMQQIHPSTCLSAQKKTKKSPTSSLCTLISVAHRGREKDLRIRRNTQVTSIST